MPKKEKIPQRGSRVKRVITFSLLGVLLVAIVVGVIVKRKTIGYLAKPDNIKLRSAKECKGFLQSGPFTLSKDGVDGSTYTAADGALQIGVTYEGDAISGINADFNAYELPSESASDPVGYAMEILNPFLTKPEVEALGLIVSKDLMSNISNDVVDYERQFGNMKVQADGNISDGDVHVDIINEP